MLQQINAGVCRQAIVFEVFQKEVVNMSILKFGRSRAPMVAALLFAIATPVMADNDDGWFWGKGFMGHWFRGEMMGRDMMDGWGPGMMMGTRFNEERLNALKNELAITDVQKKVWEDYAASVKDAVASMREAHVQMMSGSIPTTLPERIAQHEGIMTGRLEAMKSTNAATLTLYNALDSAQKKKADELILGMGMM
jgi:LTXXQ motif family protein